MRITPFVALILSALLAACASELQNPLMGGFFADPGKYEFYSCEQLLPQRAYHESREQKLKLLMDKARQSTGGAALCWSRSAIWTAAGCPLVELASAR